MSEIEISEIEDKIAANEVGVYAVFNTMRQMIERLEAQLEEANKKGIFDDYVDKLSETDLYKYESQILKLENELAEAKQATWQPIESAPKDGTFIDVWVPNRFGGRRWTNIAWNAERSNGGWYDMRYDSTEGFIDYPTHWQPLPPAPEGDKT